MCEVGDGCEVMCVRLVVMCVRLVMSECGEGLT